MDTINDYLLIVLVVWMVMDLITMYRLEKEVKILREWIETIRKYMVIQVDLNDSAKKQGGNK